MMDKIKILLIDDSNIVHLLLEKILAEYNDMELTGEAYNGEQGVRLNRELSPDVAIMDINMPKLNGLEAISRIMETKPLPIIVFSSASSEIVNLSFKAIERGAVDIVEKPMSEGFDDLKERIKISLIPKVRSFADFKVIRSIRKSALLPLKEENRKLQQTKKSIIAHHKKITRIYRKVQTDTTETPPKKAGKIPAATRQNFPVIAIAASTGGPQTLKKLFETINYYTVHAAFVIVQHMADGFLKGFAEWLSPFTGYNVKLAEKGEAPVPDTIYIAPHEYHLVFDKKERFDMLDSPHIFGIRPAATILFNSMGKIFNKRLLALVLTGMGNDGTDGLKTIKDNDGYIIAQGKESCLLYGMPKSAIESGYVDTILNLEEIPAFLSMYCKKEVFS